MLDDSLDKYFENIYFSYFSSTKTLHSDFWYIWARCGLLDYVCNKLRSKYAIPQLDYNEDCVFGEVPVDDFNNVTIETHKFYDSWAHKDEFREELEGLIHQLRLHRGSFSILFEKIFYYTQIDSDQKWEGIDSEALLGLISPSQDKVQIEGFTVKEIKKIKSDVTNKIKEILNKRKLSDGEKQAINKWCSCLSRKTKPPKSKEEICLVIEQMKRYRHLGEGRSEELGYGIVRQTSGVSAGNISQNVTIEPSEKEKNYSDAWFRGLVKDLYDRFPILHDYIADYQKKLIT